jgi:Maltose acetyltransferase
MSLRTDPLAIISRILLGENYRTSPKMALSDNKQKMLRGELYYAFTPELVAARARCKHACARYNNAGEVSRRRLTELWRE